MWSAGSDPSANPEAAHSVLCAKRPVTLMNAHVCLQAPCGWRDLRRARFRGRELRRVVRNWLLEFAVRFGVTAFYLWDLLPAVYISHPELFDENLVAVRSTVDDLETGTLVVADAEERGAGLNMPARILEVEQFKKTLFAAWQHETLGVCV
ncbi:MAG: nucleoside hydrolase [Chloroflexi bacterium]|nr:nucleoside hydrolase [Chloroflexota bacterium]